MVLIDPGLPFSPLAIDSLWHEPTSSSPLARNRKPLFTALFLFK
jgi:hypothetical protein